MAADHSPNDSHINIRALKIIVVVMGILIVIGVAVIVVTIVNRLRAMSDAAPPAGFGEVAVPVAEGARVTDMTADDGRLLLRLEESGEIRVVIIDLATGAPLGTVRLEPVP